MHMPTVLSVGVLTAGALAVVACGSSSSSSALPGSAGGSGTAATLSGGQYCALARAVADSSNQLSSLSPSSDLNQVRSLVAGFAATVDAAAAAAPSSITSDWNTLKTAYDGATADLAQAKSTSDAFSILGSKFDTQAINTAGQNVDKGTKAACGFTISTPSPSPGATGTGSSSSGGAGTETATSSSSS